MKLNNYNTIAIIPARGGSKRIKNKNIINFFGKPIINHTIDIILKSKIFDKVFVSTDSDKIKKIVQKKIDVPFLRSKKNSKDSSIIKDVLLEVLSELKKKNFNFKYCCCIYPTAVFLNKKDLSNGLKILRKNNLITTISVSKFQNQIMRSFEINKKHLLKFKYPKYSNKNSQFFKDYFFDAGQFLWVDVKKFLKSKSLVNKKTGYLELPNFLCHDIDTKEDLKLAKFKYLYLKRLKKNF